jgi:hypothetical protein
MILLCLALIPFLVGNGVSCRLMVLDLGEFMGLDGRETGSENAVNGRLFWNSALSSLI